MSPATRLHYRDYSGPMLPWLSAGCSRSHAWRHSQRVWHKWLGGPAKFSCWISLAVTQILVPQASFTGHLCGVLAGLMHVYIPKAGTEFQSSATMPPANCSTPVMVVITFLMCLSGSSLHIESHSDYVAYLLPLDCRYAFAGVL